MALAGHGNCVLSGQTAYLSVGCVGYFRLFAALLCTRCVAGSVTQAYGSEKVLEHVRDGYGASSSLGDCPAEPRAGHPSTAKPPRDCPGHGALYCAPQTRDLMQVNGPHACGAYWHTRAAWATMPGWLVMTAGPSCGGWP
jgi:hypothetical protein